MITYKSFSSKLLIILNENVCIIGLMKFRNIQIIELLLWNSCRKKGPFTHISAASMTPLCQCFPIRKKITFSKLLRRYSHITVILLKKVKFTGDLFISETTPCRQSMRLERCVQINLCIIISWALNKVNISVKNNIK